VRQKVTALKKTEENLKKFLDSMNSMLEAGVKTASDVAEANANYQQAVYKRTAAESELFAEEANFEMLTGLRASENIELPDIKLPLPSSLDKLIAQSMSANHDLKRARFLERSAESKLRVARGKLSPTFDLVLRAGRNLTKEEFNNSKNTYSAVFQVDIPIFKNDANQGGNAYSSIAIANQEALKAKFSAEDALLQIKKECVVNWNKYISANAMIKTSRFAVKSAELTSESNLEEAALGTKSNVEIIDAENKLLDARINLANSRKEKALAALEIHALSGELSLRSLLSG
jgi:outer membrane protein